MLFEIYKENIKLATAHHRTTRSCLWLFSSLTAVKAFGLLYIFSVAWKVLQLKLDVPVVLIHDTVFFCNISRILFAQISYTLAISLLRADF